MAEYSADTIALSLRVEQVFHETNLAIANPTMSNTRALTAQEERAEAVAYVRYYTEKVIYYRKSQRASVDEPDRTDGSVRGSGRFGGLGGLDSVFVRAHVDEGCAAEQLFKWYAKAVTGKFLPGELLMMIVKVGYPWHYPVLPKAPVPKKFVDDMMELGVAMGFSEVGEFVRKHVL